MSISDVTAILQAIFGGVGLLIAIIGGILGVLGYFKVMKGIDDNAKERQTSLENAAKLTEAGVKDVTHKFELMSTRNKYALIALLAAAGFLMGSWMFQVTQLRKEWDKIRKA